MRAPRRSLNPQLLGEVEASGRVRSNIASAAGWPNYTDFFETLRSERVRVTPLMVERLERVADAVGFPKDEIFLDEAGQ